MFHTRFHMNNAIYITYIANIDLCNDYILVKEDVIEVNPCIIQLFHRVQCIGLIWLTGQIQSVVFIRGWRLWLCLHCILRLLSKGAAAIKTAAINHKHNQYWAESIRWWAQGAINTPKRIKQYIHTDNYKINRLGYIVC